MTSMSSKTTKMTIVVTSLSAKHELVINTPTEKPAGICHLKLEDEDIGQGQPLQFNATLVNPKPVGTFNRPDCLDPGNRTVRGTRRCKRLLVSNADLSTIKGIGGTLSSTAITLELERHHVHGTTDTPTFKLRTSGHPVPLHMSFMPLLRHQRRHTAPAGEMQRFFIRLLPQMDRWSA